MMFFRRRQREQELDREIRSHLDLEAEERQSDGVSADQARNAAHRAFGNAALVREDTRATWGWTSFERLVQDLRYATRVLRKAPAFTAVAVLSLALGIGANTAVFSLLDAALLKTLSVRDPDQLRILRWVKTRNSIIHSHSGYETTDARIGQRVRASFSYPGYRLLAANVPQFSDLVAFAGNQFTVIAGGTSEYADGHLVSGNYFTGLGVQPLIGRPILPENDGPSGPRVVMLSYRYWQKRFAGDPTVIGREIMVNRLSVPIAGVLPPHFEGLYPGPGVDIFLPLAAVDEVGTPWYSTSRTDNWWVQVFGRLKPGISDQAAASSIQAVLNGHVRDYAGNVREDAIPHVLLAPGAQGVELFQNDWSTRLKILSGAAALVLLIACVNLANLVLARAAGRGREIAVRLAIGAGRSRLLRQFMTESLALAIAGAALGALLADPLSRTLVYYWAGTGSLSLDIRIDARALAFTIGLSLFTVLLFGLAPAWRAARADLTAAMKGSGKGAAVSGRMRLGRVLVVAQVALSVLLLVAAGLFVRTLRSLTNVDLGFRPEHVLTFQTDAGRAGYKGQRAADLYARMQEKIAAIPGVEAAGWSHTGLIQYSITNDDVYIPGRQIKPENRNSNMLFCSETFLGAMRIPILVGRSISAADRFGATKVAVVNEALARRIFDGANPVGESIYFGNFKKPDPGDGPIRIVGLAKDAHYSSVRGAAPATVYMPYAQSPERARNVTFVIRAVLPPLSIAGAVRRAVADIDRTLPVAKIRTQEEQIQNTLGTERLFAGLVSGFGALAAILAAIGLYGVLAYTVARRTAEIGVRIALGATRSNVQWLVLRESLLTVVLGIAIGTPAALWLTKLIKSALYGVDPKDTFSFAAAVVLMLAVTAVSAWIPARRSARVDPMVALRYE
jgi:predicted permease